MKIKLILGLLFLSLVFSSLVSADSILDTLNGYYEADMNEDIDKMIKLTDFTIVDKSERDEVEKDTRVIMDALAQSYDTVSYKLSEEEVFKNGDEAMVIYKLNAEIRDRKGDIALINSYYVAVMHKSNGKWGVTFTQPKATYEQNMLIMDITDTATTNLENTRLQSVFDELDIKGPSCFGEFCEKELILEKEKSTNILMRIWNFILSLFRGSEVVSNDYKENDIDSNETTTEPATTAYQEYIVAYNKLTDLMSEGKGDTPEAQQAYKEYKTAKERYEQIAKGLK